jgi:hypothetical protein
VVVDDLGLLLAMYVPGEVNEGRSHGRLICRLRELLMGIEDSDTHCFAAPVATCDVIRAIRDIRFSRGDLTPTFSTRSEIREIMPFASV